MEEKVTPEIIYQAVESFCVGIGIDGLPTYAEDPDCRDSVATFANDLISEDY